MQYALPIPGCPALSIGSETIVDIMALAFQLLLVLAVVLVRSYIEFMELREYL